MAQSRNTEHAAVPANGVDEAYGVFVGNAQSQATVVTIPPGERFGGPANRELETDQWLFVVDGSGVAIVETEVTGLAPGGLLLIEAGDAYEVRNIGTTPLKAIKLHVPSAYDGHGF